jgi:predicted Rossmann fold nucleotide-binding protein DprA/Smf involved in DNA uptake
VLFGCGDAAVLDAGGLAVVGSRDANDAMVAYSEAIGRLTAQARQTIVSGGARGVDQAAMRGALEVGGKVIGVLADSLEKAVMNRENRDALLEERLVLVSPFDPSAGFNVGNAMQRNKLIYALADAALVVNSDVDKGGTWAGATEQLNRLRLVAVYVRSTGEIGRGLEALRQKGAVPWPNPSDSEGLKAALQRKPESTPPSSKASLPLEPMPLPVDSTSPSEELFYKVRELLLRLLTRPKTEAEIGTELHVTTQQARDWLLRLASEGILERRGRPAGYVVTDADLFGPASPRSQDPEYEDPQR